MTQGSCLSLIIAGALLNRFLTGCDVFFLENVSGFSVTMIAVQPLFCYFLSSIS